MVFNVLFHLGKGIVCPWHSTRHHPNQFLHFPKTSDFWQERLSKKMNDDREKSPDVHLLFFTSQNENLQEAERQQAEQGLRELSAGYVYVPPPTVQVTSSQRPSHSLDENQRTPEDQASNETSPTSAQANSGRRRKKRVTKNRPRKPIVIPANAEIIVLSSDSEEEPNSVRFALRKQQIRPRIYHPQSHTSTSWHCPVTTCRRHNPEFGFEKHAYVERHLRNRHANELVYPCIRGCSVAFSNGREWEKHHLSLHADEGAE